MPDNKSTGAAWVDRFLLPYLVRRFSAAPSISCLQIAPDDNAEAHHLRKLGYPCDMTTLSAGQELAYPDSSFDFAFTGRFSLLAPDPPSRVKLAKELHRVLRPAGSLLLAVGNRYCPVDLTRNGRLFHGPRAHTCLSLEEMEDLLVRRAGFKTIIPLPVNQHFGWGSLPATLRPLGIIMDAYWRLVVTPSIPWLYSSPLNPTLLLWLNKD